MHQQPSADLYPTAASFPIVVDECLSHDGGHDIIVIVCRICGEISITATKGAASVRIYLDTCCLMRAFDDQSFPRVRLETLAISDVMGYVQAGQLEWVSGKTLYLEVSACPSNDRRDKALKWLRLVSEWQDYAPEVVRQVKRLTKHGLAEWDARHIATAEIAKCDWFLTTDQTLIKRANKLSKLSVRVANPTEFILEDIS